MAEQTKPLVGIFDSGVGGLSVLRELKALMPMQPFFYIADQANVPYGERSLQEVRELSEGITRFLLAQSAGLIVVACNTASAAALKHLRTQFPNTPFVGMEPAVKPAAQATRSRVVGVLATPATFQGELFHSVVERFASDITVLTDTCPGLVRAVEANALNAPATRAILERAIQPMLAQGADTLVLGCTHYPFALPLIRAVAGQGVQIIDPAPAVARRARCLLEERGWLAANTSAPSQTIFATTGSPARLQKALHALINQPGKPLALRWQAGALTVRLPERKQYAPH